MTRLFYELLKVSQSSKLDFAMSLQQLTAEISYIVRDSVKVSITCHQIFMNILMVAFQDRWRLNLSWDRPNFITVTQKQLT